MSDIRKRIEAIQRQVSLIEEEIRKTPYHKGTEHHIGLLRARLAKLKDQIIEHQAKRRGGGPGFAVKQHGDATVVLVGFPSVGKSTLLNALTNAKSPTAEYAFTTVTVIPGMMRYKGAAIQILDVPGLIEGAARGRGRGREVLSVVRSADLLLLIVEAGHEQDFRKIEEELYENGVRVNETPPNVVIKKQLRGGFKINSSLKQEFDKETIKSIAKEFGLTNAEITLKERLSIDRLVDAFAKNRAYVPALYVINKVDAIENKRFSDAPIIPSGIVNHQIRPLPISAEKRIGLEKLREAIWDRLGLVRVYLRRPDGTVDRDEPMIMREGQTLVDVAEKVGTEFAKSKKEAKIWGSGARFPGQRVSLMVEIRDGMEVMFL